MKCEALVVDVTRRTNCTVSVIYYAATTQFAVNRLHKVDCVALL